MGRALKVVTIFLAVAWPAGAAGSSLVPQAVGGTITVDPTRTHQTITGWEATTRMWEDDKVNDRFDPTSYQYMSPVLDALVNRLGVNRLRLEIRSGDENPVDYWPQYVNGTLSYLGFKDRRYEKINDNADPNSANPAGFQWSQLDWKVERIVLPMQTLLAARGERLYINLCYVDFNTGQQGSLSHGTNAPEYAELVATAFQHLKTKYNIVPDAFEISLEPENTRDWRGPQIGQGMIAAVSRLNAAGFFPVVIAPSNTAAAGAVTYFDQMIAAVPASLQTMRVFSYHRYDNPGTATLQAIAGRAQTHGLQTAMSEWLNGDIQTLSEDLTLVNVSFWQQWAISTKNVPDTGNYYLTTDITNPTSPVVNLTSRSNLLQQYFKYVRLNAVRIGATSTNTATYDPVAFRNADGRQVVVVRNGSTTPFLVTGLPAGTYGITYSSPGISNVSRPDVTIPAGGTITTQGGSSGAVTIFQKSGPTPIPGTLQFSAATFSIGENGGQATITVTRAGGSSGAVSVSYAASSGTAAAGSDFTAASGTLSWAAGETASKTFAVPITDDALAEASETVTLTLSGPTGGAILGTPATATLTITDNDPTPGAGSLQFSASTMSVGENGGQASITVTRTGGSSGAVSVAYATTNGTAVAGSDYAVGTGTLSWAAGDTAGKTFTVSVTNDPTAEGNETVMLTLSGPTGGAPLGTPASAILTIVDDDSLVGAPTGLLAQPGDGRVTLTWNSAGGATSYTVYRASAPGVTRSNFGSLPGGMSYVNATRPFVLTGLANGTTWYFVVTASSSAGESAESVEASATPFSSGWPIPDTDGDGYSDAAEIASGSNPGDPASTPVDADRDGMADSWEAAHFGGTTAQPGSDPDGDGASNLLEYGAQTDPTNPDTDGDGSSDGQELSAGTDPLAPAGTPGGAGGNASRTPCGMGAASPGNGAGPTLFSAMILGLYSLLRGKRRAGKTD